MSSKSKIITPKDTDSYCLFTVSPLYGYMCTAGTDILATIGIPAAELERVHFEEPLYHINGIPVVNVLAAKDELFTDIAENLGRLGITQRERGLYWRIDRYDLLVRKVPAVSLGTRIKPMPPARVSVFTPSNQIHRYFAVADEDGSFSIGRTQADDGIVREAKRILGEDYARGLD